MTKFRLSPSQASRLRQLASNYDPPILKSWRHKEWDEDRLWLRILSQIVVAGNSAPGDVLMKSPTVKKTLAFSRLKKMNSGQRRKLIHVVLKAIGTRYVRKSPHGDKKIDAAGHNFTVLNKCGGPKKFFGKVQGIKSEPERIQFLIQKSGLKFFKNKGARDILIELGLAKNCMALDQRIANILEKLGTPIRGSINRQYEAIEEELIMRVATPCELSGGELDRVLFRNFGDIMVRLACS